MVWLMSVWFAGISLQGSVLSGNSNLMVLTGRVEGGYRAGSARLSAWVRGTYSLQDTVITANTLEAAFQTDQPLHPRVEVFLLAAYYADPVARVSYRSDGGVGVKYRFLEDSLKEISLSVAPLYSVEKYAGRSETRDVRWSVRPKVEWFSAEGIRVYGVVFYQPRVDRMRDFRVVASLRLEAPLTRLTRMVVEIEDRYVSEVPEGVRPNDIRFTVGLAWKREG